MTFPLYPKNGLPVRVQNDKNKIEFKLNLYFQYIVEGAAVFFQYKKKNSFKHQFDLCICGDPLSFLHLFLLKNLLKIKKIVYLNVDYTAQRFKNPILNFIYLKLNQFSIKRCDYLFYLIPALVNQLDPEKKYRSKSFHIRHWFNSKNIDLNKKRESHSIIFAGNITYAVEFEELFIALVDLKKEKIPFHMSIYGEGDKKDSVLRRVKDLNLESEIMYRGVAKNEDLTQTIFPSYQIGICPYITKPVPGKSEHMFNLTDLSTKLTEYCAAGLPIVTTRLSPALDVIPENKFGFLANNSHQWYTALKTLLQNKDLCKTYSKNSLAYSKNYDEEVVLTPIIKKIV